MVIDEWMGIELQNGDRAEYLGVTIQTDLRWNSHIYLMDNLDSLDLVDMAFLFWVPSYTGIFAIYMK